MRKHKIVLLLKSNFAFERFKKLFETEPIYRKNFDVHYENINTYDDLAYYLDFHMPEMAVIDSKLNEFERLKDLLLSKQIPLTLFDSEFNATIEHLKEHFELSNEVEDETIKEIKISKEPNKEKEKVVIKEKIIEKEIIKTNYTTLRSKIVVVASLWEGAGSTTFGVNLGRAIASRGLEVSYVEYPLAKPYLFDFLSIPVKEQGKHPYIDIAQELHLSKVLKKHDTWNEFGINWYLTDTRNEPLKSFSYEDMLKFIYSINSVVTIVDVSHHLHDKTIQDFIHHADEVFVCIEPDPVKIDWLSTIYYEGKMVKNQRIEQQIISHLKDVEQKEGIDFQFVTMKYSPRVVKKKEWESCLEKKPIVYFPVIPYEVLMKNVWESKFLYDLEEYKELMEQSLKSVIVKLLPREFYSLNTEKKKNSILNLFKKGE